MVEHSGVKEPKAGQWWQYNGVRVFVVGLKLNGHAVCEYRDGALATLVVGDSWKHIPDCTGFDYMPVWEPFAGQVKPTSRTIGADGNDERDASKLSGPKWITMLEVVREGALGREVVWVEHPGGLWQTGQTRSMRVQ